MADPKIVEITAADLPLHCPMPGQAGSISHPRVFLSFEGKNEVRCPYCSTVYKLVGNGKRHHH